MGMFFDGKPAFSNTSKRLNETCGNTSWLSEYTPVRFPSRETITELLSHFYKHISCFLGGCFVLFTVGVFTFFQALSLYVTKYDTPLLNAIYIRKDMR